MAQQVERCHAVVVAGDRLAIDDARVRLEQRQRLDDQREARGQIVARPAVEAHLFAGLAGDDAETVVLNLVQPFTGRGRAWGLRREAGGNEAGREHGRKLGRESSAYNVGRARPPKVTKAVLAALLPERLSVGITRVAKMKTPVDDVLGRGVYGAADALRLINFRRRYEASTRSISRQTVTRWLRGYNYSHGGEVRHSGPLWRPDYANNDDTIELSFRDLIELRFVKAFRDVGLSLPTIRQCFMRAVDAVKDQRPFSTQRFRTDGKTIFLEITHDVREGELLDLKRRQGAFHRMVAPSLHDLEFDADIVARWFPLGMSRKTIVVDPTRAFGRPIVVQGGVPAEILSEAVEIEGSPERVAKLYEVPLPAVRDAVVFQQRLAA